MATNFEGMSTTEKFKTHIQSIVFQELGVKVSKDKAWKMFKALVKGVVQFTLKTEGNKVSLAGVGNFEIKKAAARGKKAGLDENGNQIPGAVVWPFVPKFRFRPSSVISNEVEKFFDLGGHDDITLADYGIFREDAVVEEVAQAPVAEAPVETPVVEAPAQTAPVDDMFNL